MSDTSIRTPVWGVTERKAVLGALVVISIRTPAWGVTSVVPSAIAPVTFQFAPPRGGVTVRRAQKRSISYISIRTPPRGG